MKTLIIDHEPDHVSYLEKNLSHSHPAIDISGYASNGVEALNLINTTSPSLVIIEVDMPQENAFELLQKVNYNNFETIFMGHTTHYAMDAIKYQASGYVLKPLQINELLSAVQVAEKRLADNRSTLEPTSLALNKGTTQLPQNIIGIPTLEGFEFLDVQEIIRCEGFQRCTRIITKDKTDILSSYHIGVFKKRLATHRFFATHKSHLINLIHIKKYLKEGTIKMSDGAFVPVSKRRKSDFVKLITTDR